jgi:hypothetical protein
VSPPRTDRTRIEGLIARAWRPAAFLFALRQLILLLVLVGVSDLATTQSPTFHLDDEEEAPPDAPHPERIPQREKTSCYVDRSATLESARPGAATHHREARMRRLPMASTRANRPLLSPIPGEYQIPLRC